MDAQDFGRLFETFTRSAFRLECLPTYEVPQDVQWLRRFREGETRPQERDNRPWLQTVRNAKARGARMQRVRLIEQSLTEYQRFQFSWGYPENTAAGEEISILDHRPDGLLLVDFWLFDDETVVVLEYDDDGRFLRPLIAETVEPYRQARDIALKSATPFREYRTRLATSVGEHVREPLNDPAVMSDIARLALSEEHEQGRSRRT
jgi:hypothetical protein